MSLGDFEKEVQRLFKVAVDETFYSSAEHEVFTTEATQTLASEYDEFFMLTISSQAFRVITLIHLNNDTSTKAYVAKKLNVNTDTLTDDKLYDFIGELGNTLCGSIKRNIHNFVPSLGLSTPNRLGKDCIKYMLSQEPSYKGHTHIEINGQALFECGVYVCTDTEIDYDISPTTTNHAASEMEDLDCGELELF